MQTIRITKNNGRDIVATVTTREQGVEAIAEAVAKAWDELSKADGGEEIPFRATFGDTNEGVVFNIGKRFPKVNITEYF